jgi:tetratricopeptide (TPR) repeat protein
MNEVEELYHEALAYYNEADGIAKEIGDLALRKDLMTRILEVNRIINSYVEVNLIREIRSFMEKAEEDLRYNLALQYSEFIINIYKDLGITDNQTAEDKKRIERKIALDKEVTNYNNMATEHEANESYDDALYCYEIVYELYGVMDISVSHERYRNTLNDINRIKGLIAELEAAQKAVEPDGVAEDGEADLGGEEDAQIDQPWDNFVDEDLWWRNPEIDEPPSTIDDAQATAEPEYIPPPQRTTAPATRTTQATAPTTQPTQPPETTTTQAVPPSTTTTPDPNIDPVLRQIEEENSKKSQAASESRLLESLAGTTTEPQTAARNPEAED